MVSESVKTTGLLEWVLKGGQEKAKSNANAGLVPVYETLVNSVHKDACSLRFNF